MDAKASNRPYHACSCSSPAGLHDLPLKQARLVSGSLCHQPCGLAQTDNGRGVPVARLADPLSAKFSGSPACPISVLRPVSFTSQCASPCLGATRPLGLGVVHQDCHLNGEEDDDDDDEPGDVGGTHFQTEAWFWGLQV